MLDIDSSGTEGIRPARLGQIAVDVGMDRVFRVGYLCLSVGRMGNADLRSYLGQIDFLDDFVCCIDFGVQTFHVRTVSLMHILITGGQGQLGQALQAALTIDQITAIDLPDHDITDKDAISALVADIKPDIIINCAAYTNVDGCVKDPELLIEQTGSAHKTSRSSAKTTTSH